MSKAVVLGLAVGDSLGSTSEFEIPWNVTQHCINRFPGWPNKQVGNHRRWGPGEPTDDSEMAMCILRSLKDPKNDGKLNPDDLAKRFVAWSQSTKAIGRTTSFTLGRIKSGMSFYDSTKQEYQSRPQNNAANGSLMRNGVLGAMFWKASEEQYLIESTVLQSLVTHFGPLPVLCCVVHSLLIGRALAARNEGRALSAPPTTADIRQILEGAWQTFKKTTRHPVCMQWLQDVGSALPSDEAKLIDELNGFENFDPYHQDYRGRSGYCVLTLQISLWGLHWSFQPSHPPLPDWLPTWPFEKHEFSTIMWIVLIGADADTYAATAGPLLAAYHPDIPESLLEGLQLRHEIEQLMQ